MMTTPLRYRRTVATVCLAAVTLFGAVACSSSTDTLSTTENSGAQITITDYGFQVPSSVKPGATITIRNNDKVEHSVTSVAVGVFDAEADGNETATFKAPTTPGSFDIYCRYHPQMHGILVVAP